jgi:ribosomal protein S21
MAVGVKVRNDNIEVALQIFKTRVYRAGILEEYKVKQEGVKPSVKKKEKIKRAQKRRWREKQ